MTASGSLCDAFKIHGWLFSDANIIDNVKTQSLAIADIHEDVYKVLVLIYILNSDAVARSS